jgi:hypothetical protein
MPKQRRKKSKVEERVGRIPNPFYFAMTDLDLHATRNYERMTSMCDISRTPDSVWSMPDEERKQLMLYALPQRSDLWLQLRAQCMTGTSVSTALGFNEQCALDMLGGKPYMVDHTKVEQLALRMGGGNAATDVPHVSVAMDWGTLHEPNCKIATLRILHDMVMQEVGMAVVRLGELPPAVVHGVDLALLPRLAASPDGILILGEQSCSILNQRLACDNLQPGMHVLFEAKCKSAFVDGNGGRYQFIGSNKQPVKEVLPHWFAQVQLGMLATNVRATVLAVYNTSHTMLLCIPFNATWCNMMLKAVQWFMQTYVQAGVLPPPDFCKGWPRFPEFTKLTKKACTSAAKHVMMVPSVNNTTSSLLWLDDGAAKLPPAV